MVYNSLSGWRVEFCNRRVRKEFEHLPSDMRINFAQLVKLIETYGLENIHEPHVKHLEGKLWEMRMRGRDGIARAAYIAAIEKRVMILHCFVKKTQHTPRDAIDLALKRAREEGLL